MFKVVKNKTSWTKLKSFNFGSTTKTHIFCQCIIKPILEFAPIMYNGMALMINDLEVEL
jgi:hypothetical protein